MKNMLESIASKINPQYFIILGSIITVFGAYLAAIKTDKGSEKTNLSIEENKMLARRNIDLNISNNTLGEANKTLLNENLEYAKLQKELSKINIKLINKVKEKSNDIDEYNKGTGGYCYMLVLMNHIDNYTSTGNLTFVCNGKNPLRDLTARIFDVNLFESSQNFDTSNTNIVIGNVYPGQSYVSQYTIHLDKLKGVRLNIFYTSNYGFFTETVRMLYINNQWERENVVYDHQSHSDKPVYLNRTKNYPIKNSSKEPLLPPINKPNTSKSG